MTLEDAKRKIEELAVYHQKEEHDELAMGFEMNANEVILEFLIDNNIPLGSYNLQGLYSHAEEFQEDWSEILAEINFEVISENPTFPIHPNAKELFNCFNEAFWPSKD